MLGIDAEGNVDSEVENAILEEESQEEHQGQAQEEGSGQEHDAGEFGCALVPEAYVPAAPSIEEVRKHELSHWPFRNWCIHCQRGKAKESGHRRKGPRRNNRKKEVDAGGRDPVRGEDLPHEHPVVSIDYMYLDDRGEMVKKPKDEEELKKLEDRYHPILVVHDDWTSAVFAHVMS